MSTFKPNGAYQSPWNENIQLTSSCPLRLKNPVFKLPNWCYDTSCEARDVRVRVVREGSGSHFNFIDSSFIYSYLF